MSVLEDFEEGCVRCGLCVERCPQFDVDIIDSIMDYLRGEGEGEGLSLCLTCGLCRGPCPNGLAPLDLIKEARLKRVEETGPTPASRVIDALDPCSAFAVSEERTPLPDVPQGAADVILFPGCFTSYFYPFILESAMSLLDRADVKYSVMAGKEWCCGIVPLNAGNRVPAETLAPRVVDEIVRRGGKVVLTGCPGCFMALDRVYPTLLGSIPFEVRPLSAFLSDLVDEGRLPKGDLDRAVRYHDPCHLLRSAGVDDRGRSVVTSAGPRVVNPTTEDSTCCGFGGGVRNNHPDVAQGIAASVCQMAEGQGADLMVTNCTGCFQNLNDAGDMEVMDLSELMYRSLGGEPDRDDERDRKRMGACFKEAHRRCSE